MVDKLIDEIKELQANIEKEKDDELTFLLMSLAASMDDKDDSNTDEQRADHNLAILVWLCLKVDLECQALKDGHSEIESDLRSDIDEVFNLVQKCEYEWDLTRSVVSDAIDLLLSIGTIHERDLQAYGSRYVTKSMRNQKEISEDMYYLFTSVTRQLVSVGEEKKAYHLIEKLCWLSRIRNDEDIHKQLVVHALSVIFDNASSEICRIASIEEKNFAEDCSEYASDFYWFYACSLWKEENASAAGIYFKICYSIRKEVYGEEHWLTALAKRNTAIIDYVSSKNAVARENLLEFVNRVEEKRYIDMTPHEEIQAETIWFLLSGQFNAISELPMYEALIDIYARLCNGCDGIGNGRISKRLAWNFRGNYYLQQGEYILAENAFQNALEEKENPSAVSILSDDQIKTNLLVIANVQNDFSATSSVLSILSDDDDLSETDSLRLYTTIIGNYMQAGIELDEEELRDIKGLARELCEGIISEDNSLDGTHVAAAMFVYSVAVFFLQNYCADAEEQKLYLDSLRIVEKDVLTYSLSVAQRQLIILAEALLAWNLNLPEAEKYINKALSGAEQTDLPILVKASINHTAAAYFGRRDKRSTAMRLADTAMTYLTEVWHSYIKYANDTRLVNILSPIQIQFSSCYAIVRRFSDVENAYERVLQFKMLASLAGRERNRVTHSVEMDPGLIKEINAVQDRLAELETAGIFQDQIIEHENLEVKLRELESSFAMRFPSEADFKEITWDLVSEAIPDNSVILEYYLAIDDFGQTQFETHPDNDELEVFELFFVKKQNGKTILKRICIKDATKVLEKAERLISIYQEKSENAGASENEHCLEDLRYDLYEALIKPVIHEIGEGMTVYFAPDSTLVNLPFELLYEDESLEESHQIVKIECARDFLFTSPNTPPTKRGLVIGNPEYSIKENEITKDEEKSSEQTRAIDIDLMEIEQLPFAEVEAQRVADYFSTFPWTGRGAAKEKLLMADGYQNLHIATHGYFDLSGETDSIYSSCLLFAGVKNWMQNLTVSRKYGNGIVTADEISRLDLKSTKLVVLSSCLNGRSDKILSKGFQGMVGAFAAAGVKYVIAHLWNAPETIGTVILMDTFYYCYTEEKMEPPLALAKAKEYLKKLTIDEMREQGWFDYVRNSDLDFQSKRSVAVLEKCNGCLKPYKDEIFWGGFSCYRCN